MKRRGRKIRMKLGGYKGTKLFNMCTFFSLFVMVCLIWWYVIFPENHAVRDLCLTYFLLYVLYMIIFILALLDQKYGNKLPAATLIPHDFPHLNKVFLLAIVTVYVAFTFIPQIPSFSLFESTNLFELAKTIGGGGAVFIALFIWGFIIPCTEEKLFSAALMPTSIEIAREMGSKRNLALLIGIFGTSILFAFFHFYVSSSSLNLLIYFFFFRLIINYVDLRFNGYLYGIFVHGIINSYIITLIFNVPFWYAVIPSLGVYIMLKTVIPRLRFY